VRLADRVVSGTHVKQHAAVFQQRRLRMTGKIGLDRLGQLRGGRRFHNVPYTWEW